MSAHLAAGTVFAARYRVVRCIAAGGMGAVYEVVHLETDRRHALKVMHPHLFQSEEMRDRFKLEARIAAQVDSEYIVYVSDAGVDEATEMPFLVMELLRGEELGVRLKRMKRLPPEEVVTYMQQAAWALDRTHAASIVHRDLKPQNLFLTIREDGTPRIKILDFGVAKLIAESSTVDGSTQSLGTPLYMAPEQFRARKKLTSAADIHALTMMTYTLLVGKAYWSEESKRLGDMIAFAMLAVNGPEEPAVQRAARHGVTLPPGFDAWFAKGTAVDPAQRFPSATEAVRALRGVDGLDGFGTAMSAMRPFTVSDSSLPLVESRALPPPVAPMERSITSAGNSVITAPPAERRRAPVLAASAILGLSVLGAGALLSLRGARGSAETSNQAAQISSAAPTASAVAPPAPPAASATAPVEVVPAGIAPPKRPVAVAAIAPTTADATAEPPLPRRITPPTTQKARPLPRGKLLGPD